MRREVAVQELSLGTKWLLQEYRDTHCTTPGASPSKTVTLRALRAVSFTFGICRCTRCGQRGREYHNTSITTTGSIKTICMSRRQFKWAASTATLNAPCDRLPNSSSQNNLLIYVHLGLLTKSPPRSSWSWIQPLDQWLTIVLDFTRMLQ